MALWYLESNNKQFSLYSLLFSFLVVLMKRHKMSGKWEKSKGVKNTGILRWVEEGWKMKEWGTLTHPETHKETSDILQHSLTLISMPKPHCLFYSTRDAETWGDIT